MPDHALTDCDACQRAAFLAESGFVVEEVGGVWWQGPYRLGPCVDEISEQAEINNETKENAA